MNRPVPAKVSGSVLAAGASAAQSGNEAALRWHATWYAILTGNSYDQAVQLLRQQDPMTVRKPHVDRHAFSLTNSRLGDAAREVLMDVAVGLLGETDDSITLVGERIAEIAGHGFAERNAAVGWFAVASKLETLGAAPMVLSLKPDRIDHAAEIVSALHPEDSLILRIAAVDVLGGGDYSAALSTLVDLARLCVEMAPISAPAQDWLRVLLFVSGDGRPGLRVRSA
jgi:hypothetical protein